MSVIGRPEAHVRVPAQPSAARPYRGAHFCVNPQLAEDINGDHIHLNVIRVGFDTFNATENDDALIDIDYSIYRIRNIFRPQQVGVGRVQHYAIDDADGDADINGGGEARDLWEAHFVDNDGIDAFVVRTITGLLGLSPVPGDCGKQTDDDGLLAGGVDNGAEGMSRTFSHEVGHFLGLNHNHPALPAGLAQNCGRAAQPDGANRLHAALGEWNERRSRFRASPMHKAIRWMTIALSEAPAHDGRDDQKCEQTAVHHPISAGYTGRSEALLELVQANPRQLKRTLRTLALNPDLDTGMRLEALAAIGQHAEATSLATLREAVGDADSAVSNRAIERLGKLGTSVDLDALKLVLPATGRPKECYARPSTFCRIDTDWVSTAMRFPAKCWRLEVKVAPIRAGAISATMRGQVEARGLKVPGVDLTFDQAWRLQCPTKT